MSDAGGRPQFGEYASSEQQRALSGHSALASDPALIPRDMPPGVERASPHPPRRTSIVDRVVTVALLAFGLFTVLDSIGSYTDPAALIDMLGLDAELSNYGGQRAAGVAAVAVMLVGWLATTWFVWRRGAAGKSMWWIALTAGVVFTFAGGLIVAIPLVTDPNVFDAFVQMQGLGE